MAIVHLYRRQASPFLIWLLLPIVTRLVDHDADAAAREGLALMTAEKSHRFALTGQDPEGGSRTIILWRETDLVGGRVVRWVVLTLDATVSTATVLTRAEAVEVAQAILAAAQ